MTATTHRPYGRHRLASGALVDVDPQTGVAEFCTCSWLVEVFNGNPEPDFPSDCYDIVPCGARLFGTAHEGGYRCANGHEHLPLEIEYAPYGPAWQREQEERYEEGGW